MPLDYASQSPLESHVFTRQHASLFDVSHMVQTRWTGHDHLEYLTELTQMNLQTLPLHQSKLVVLLNHQQGIQDDAIVMKRKVNETWLITNAVRKHSDLAYFQSTFHTFQQKKKNKSETSQVSWEVIENSVLLALQGPDAHALVCQTLPSSSFSLHPLPFMHGTSFTLPSTSTSSSSPWCWITRCGYTGEDGYELWFPDAETAWTWVRRLQPYYHDPKGGVVDPAPTTWSSSTPPKEVNLTSSKRWAWAGLDVRDRLRLEAGLCLYGHELDEHIHPWQARLLWCCPLLKTTSSFQVTPTTLRRVGLMGSPGRVGGEGSPLARPGDTMVLPTSSSVVGHVTSSGISPCLQHPSTPIAMGYIHHEWSSPGTLVHVLKYKHVRQANDIVKSTLAHTLEMKVCELPFVPYRYMKEKKGMNNKE
ncbi:Aminomethyltransferase, mitochondrial [Coelomomyces lativittatus]|nr:Aminomethyltransferase, mitochondrial [Coelomomyces lativittatus]